MTGLGPVTHDLPQPVYRVIDEAAFLGRRPTEKSVRRAVGFAPAPNDASATSLSRNKV
jgi:hypothetical protein